MIGAQAYSYSGKPESVEWMVKKARGKTRNSFCNLTRTGVRGTPIHFSDFFDNQERPDDISEADWQILAAKAYDCLLDCMNDEKLQHLVAGLEPGDGRGLLDKLLNMCGNKQQRMDSLDDDIDKMAVSTINQWPSFRDGMSDLLRKRNAIPNLLATEKESDAKQLRQFCSPLSSLFPTFYENYVLDTMKAVPTMLLATAKGLCDALYQSRTRKRGAGRMSVMLGGQIDSQNTAAVQDLLPNGSANGSAADYASNFFTSAGTSHGLFGKGKGGKGKGKGGKGKGKGKGIPVWCACCQAKNHPSSFCCSQWGPFAGNFDGAREAKRLFHLTHPVDVLPTNTWPVTPNPVPAVQTAMYNSYGQCMQQLTESANDESWWSPPTVVPGQITAPAVLPTTAPAVMSNEQYLAQYLAQQSSAADGSWGVPNTVQQYYNAHTPVLGWPGSSADAMSAFVTAGDASCVISALDGYAVLDSACSHRSVFNSMHAFPTGVSSDCNVTMIDSNGNHTKAPGIGAASITAFPFSTSPIDLTFPEAVYNPECPVNLICLSNILKTKDGAERDNDVSFKRLAIDLNVSHADMHRSIPIEEINGLYVIKMAFLTAVTHSNSE